MFLFAYNNKKEINELEDRQAELALERVENQINYDSENSLIDAWERETLSDYESRLLRAGIWDYETPLMATYDINGEQVTFNTYSEIQDFFSYLRTSTEENKNRNEDYSITAAITEHRRNMEYEFNEIDFQLSYSYAFEMGDVEDPTFDEIIDFATSKNIDLTTCTMNEVYLLISEFYAIEGNRDKPLNWISLLDLLKESNVNFIDLSTDEFINIAKQEVGSLEQFLRLNNVVSSQNISFDLTNILESDYKYMSNADKLAYKYFLYNEGTNKASDFLHIMELRTYDAIHGSELGYEKFEFIVEQKGWLAECVAAYATGGYEGFISWFDNVRSYFTGDYSMTVNDYEMQTIQTLLQTVIASYSDITKEDLNNFENDGLITAEQRAEIEDMMAHSNVPVKYYDVLVVTGDMTAEEAAKCAGYMQEIAGGETYARRMLSNAYSAGISTGNMIVSMAISNITGLGFLGQAAMFLSSAGGTYRELRRNGYSWTESFFVGNVMGGMEVGTEKLLGGLSGLSDKALDASETANMNWKQVLYNLLVESPKDEMEEEVFQLFVGDFVEAALTGQEYNLTDEIMQIPDTLLSTYFSTVGSNAPMYVPGAISGAIKGHQKALNLNVGGISISFTNNEMMKFINEDGTMNGEAFKDAVNKKVSDAKGKGLSSPDVKAIEAAVEDLGIKTEDTNVAGTTNEPKTDVTPRASNDTEEARGELFGLKKELSDANAEVTEESKAGTDTDLDEKEQKVDTPETISNPKLKSTVDVTPSTSTDTEEAREELFGLKKELAAENKTETDGDLEAEKARRIEEATKAVEGMKLNSPEFSNSSDALNVETNEDAKTKPAEIKNPKFKEFMETEIPNYQNGLSQENVNQVEKLYDTVQVGLEAVNALNRQCDQLEARLDSATNSLEVNYYKAQLDQTYKLYNQESEKLKENQYQLYTLTGKLNRETAISIATENADANTQNVEVEKNTDTLETPSLESEKNDAESPSLDINSNAEITKPSFNLNEETVHNVENLASVFEGKKVIETALSKIADAFVSVYGEKYRAKIEDTLNKILLVPYIMPSNIKIVLGNIKKTISNDLKIQFLNQIGVEANDSNIQNYFGSLALDSSSKIADLYKIINTMKTRELTPYEKDSLIRNLQKLTGADVNVNNYQEYLAFYENYQSNYQAMMDAFNEKMSEYNDQKLMVDNYEKTKKKLNNKYNYIFYDSIKGILSEADQLILEKYHDNPENFNYRELSIGNNFSLDNASLLSYFSQESMEQLQNGTSDEIRVIQIKQMEYFQNMGLDLGYDYEAYMNYPNISEYMPSANEIASIIEARENALLAFSNELITSTPLYSENALEVANAGMDALEILGGRFMFYTDELPRISRYQSGVVGTMVIPTVSPDGSFHAALLFNLGNADSFVDQKLFHELNHVVETALQNFDQESGNFAIGTGFETLEGSFNENNTDTQSTKPQKRSYEMLSEIVNELLAQEVHQAANNESTYVFNNPDNTKIKFSTQYELVKSLVEGFYNEFNSVIKEARISNNLDLLLDTVGSENLAELNDLVKEFYRNFNQIKYGEMMIAKRNGETTEATILYDGLVQKAQNILDNMKQFANKNSDTDLETEEATKAVEGMKINSPEFANLSDASDVNVDTDSKSSNVETNAPNLDTDKTTDEIETLSVDANTETENSSSPNVILNALGNIADSKVSDLIVNHNLQDIATPNDISLLEEISKLGDYEADGIVLNKAKVGLILQLSSPELRAASLAFYTNSAAIAGLTDLKNPTSVDRALKYIVDPKTRNSVLQTFVPPDIAMKYITSIDAIEVRYGIITKLATDQEKFAAIKYLNNDSSQIALLLQYDITSDEYKEQGLKFLTRDYDKKSVILSMTSSDLKLKYLDTISNDNYRYEIVKSLEPEYRFEGLNKITEAENLIKSLELLESSSEKFEVIKRIAKLSDKIDAIEKISLEDKKYIVENSDDDLLKAYALAAIDDNEYKLEKLKELTKPGQIIALASIKDANLRDQICSQYGISIDFIGKMILEMFNSTELNYNRHFSKEFNNILLKPFNAIRNYFSNFANGILGYYGADQNATRKYISYKIIDKSYIYNHLEEYKNFLKTKCGYSDSDVDMHIKALDAASECRLGQLKIFKDFISEMVNNDPIAYKQAYESLIDVEPIVESVYSRLQNKLQSLGVNSPVEQRKILNCINTTGICAYASVANMFYALYENNPEGFKKDFGYDMIIDIDGSKHLNSSEFLLDLYIYANSNKIRTDGKELFTFKDDGTLSVADAFKNLEDIKTSEQYNISGMIGGRGFIDDNVINSFLKSKGINYEFSSETWTESYSEFYKEGFKDPEKIIEFISREKQKGNLVSLGVYRSNHAEFRFVPNMESDTEVITTNNWNEGAGHAVFVTGIDSEYVYVASWGEEYKIKLTDFVDANFSVNSISIKKTT